MTIQKNPIPILEFDPNPIAVIAPDHEQLAIQLPKKAVFAFLENVTEEYAIKHHAKQVAEYSSVTKTYPIYVTDYQGHQVCLVQAPVGAAAATAILEFLIAYGVEEVISAGCCGALEDIAENTFLIPFKALRDEGTSYHYKEATRFVEMNRRALKAIERALSYHQLPYQEVTTWTTDGFYRETKDMVAYRKEEGCAVVEMECAALAACAEMRNIIWGQILFTADTLVNLDQYDTRSWGEDSFEDALILCLDAVINI
ncbi:nucleoside phosphorylase [Facklamia miroungae]|uniref:Uridine phosphorylase n=1 Tax=Facklamia miroungae TaxID=120956 RepID=A0A1G7UX68_9LACT|nr:nucleoside phosphorylase [Facklamia miroungae]NKZ30151.1 nucleoside phosphorylase [Facklamia miroungae]SDG51878.1 Uridine phosphorylase [Facklamia miroungae]